MSNIDLTFEIEETITYTGRVTVDQDELAAWMKSEGLTTLDAETLQDYTFDRPINVEETNDNVQGQIWTELKMDEGQEPAALTIPIKTPKAA